MQQTQEKSHTFTALKKAGILIIDPIHQKLLTINNQYGHNRGVPKGSILQDETPLEAAFRELKEETGLEFDAQSRPKIQKYYKPLTTMILFIVHIPGGSETLQLQPPESAKLENIHNIQWRTYEELAEQEQHINKTFKRSGKIYSKDHFFPVAATAPVNKQPIQLVPEQTVPIHTLSSVSSGVYVPPHRRNRGGN